MNKLTIEIETKDKEELVYALQEAIKQIGSGCSSGDLRNEDIDSGYWEITDVEDISRNGD